MATPQISYFPLVVFVLLLDFFDAYSETGEINGL